MKHKMKHKFELIFVAVILVGLICAGGVVEYIISHGAAWPVCIIGGAGVAIMILRELCNV